MVQLASSDAPELILGFLGHMGASGGWVPDVFFGHRSNMGAHGRTRFEMGSPCADFEAKSLVVLGGCECGRPERQRCHRARAPDAEQACRSSLAPYIGLGGRAWAQTLRTACVPSIWMFVLPCVPACARLLLRPRLGGCVRCSARPSDAAAFRRRASGRGAWGASSKGAKTKCLLDHMLDFAFRPRPEQLARYHAVRRPPRRHPLHRACVHGVRRHSYLRRTAVRCWVRLGGCFKGRPTKVRGRRPQVCKGAARNVGLHRMSTLEGVQHALVGVGHAFSGGQRTLSQPWPERLMW